MKSLLYTTCVLSAICPLISGGKAFTSPLEDLDFVYAEEAIQAYIDQAQATKMERAREAFLKATGEGLRQAFCPYFADIWLGRDLDRVNAELVEILRSEDPVVQQKYRLNDKWGLVIKQQFYHLYYAFGTKGSLAPGRLYPETEKALLDALWDQMKYKDDIHLARLSTWWMIGSENHDLVSKVSSLISAQIFMHEPDYKDRVYPDLGTGGGYTYWFHRMYAQHAVDGPEGRAEDKDGKDYTAADHYEAWVHYFDEYFNERARRGFFLEVASPGYMAVTVSHLTDIYDLCQDPALSEKAGNFMDVVWADWVQDQLNGVRGGAKTRADGKAWNDAMYRFARFYTGGEGSAQGNIFTLLLSKYELKPIHWHLALDREGLGEFAFLSRKPGEEEGVWPRPLGTERTLVCDTESRLLRYSWVTPDYIMGCQMDHPGAVHSHLSNQARWQGVTFKGEDGPRVYPVDLAVGEDGNSAKTKATGYIRGVQDKNVMILQQARRFTQMNPDWFPAKSISNLDYGIHFGDNLDRIEEAGGWVFVEHGDAFLAVRPVMGEYAEGWTILVDPSSPGLTSVIHEDSYDWSPDRKMIYLKDKYAGMIFEASRRDHHGSLEDFMADILDNPLVLDKTVVPGFHVLRYRGCGEDAREITFNLSNSEMPFVGGERVNYAPEMLFDSPYLKSQYKSGVVEISKGDRKLHLEFN
ncbi:MAG: hypothetical protein AB3N64_13415 [Puniceicoccaceae bacterium]